MQNGYEPTKLDYINDIYWKNHENSSIFQFCHLTHAHLELWFCIKNYNMEKLKTSRPGEFNYSGRDVFQNAKISSISTIHNSNWNISEVFVTQFSSILLFFPTLALC